MKANLKKITFLFVGLIILNYLASNTYKRFDLTEDKRYTLSETSKDIANNVSEIISIQVYLKGDFPAEFKRLQTETKLQLEEFKALNKNIHFRFRDPSGIEEDLIKKGLQPSSLQIQENGKLSELVIFPWAVVNYKNKSENISLLKDIITNSQEEQLQSSIQNLEYAFASAIHKLTVSKTKKIAVLKGNGELDDIYMADFLKKIGEQYLLAPFTLDSVLQNPSKTLNQLNNFDLAIIAKPTEKFSEEEKFVLDQYTMQGGKSLWLVDNVIAEVDSLMQTGESMAIPRDLGLTDFFFNYGVRINPTVITDLNSSQLTLATGNVGNRTQFNSFLWKYYPLVNSTNNHSITKNIGAVNTKFPSVIDTLKNSIKKTVLLQSSEVSKIIGLPAIVSLKTITTQENQTDFNHHNIPVGVLLEGKFKSAYSGRIKPFTYNNSKETGISTKMIVISDGDVIANDISNGQPLPLGFDKWTNQQFGNKEFLLNCVNYLLDDNGLIHLRSRNVKINFLNKQKAFIESGKWQLINIIFPVIVLLLFGFIFNYLRRKRYQ